MNVGEGISIPLYFSSSKLEIRFKNINEKKSIELTNIKGWKKRISLIKSDHHG